MSILKQSVGIDISKEKFTACFCKSEQTGALSFSDVHTFSNEKKGFNQFLRWASKQMTKGSELVFLMEATGVYYENLAYHLHGLGKSVIVVLPNKSKHYFASLNVKTKTDEVDAKILSRFGVERKHAPWSPPKPIFVELRNLTRYYNQLLEQKTAISNLKHSKDESHHVQDIILKSSKKMLEQFDREIEKIKLEIQKLISSDSELKAKVANLESIKGVGTMTVAIIVAETLGFEHFHSSKQLVSYAGYDVVQRESGTSVKGKTRISKKGNRLIRAALYFPAMVSTRYNQEMKANYIRIIQRKPSKMIGQVAIQRKLLVLMYTLWKTNKLYDENYKKKVAPSQEEATQDTAFVESCSLMNQK